MFLQFLNNFILLIDLFTKLTSYFLSWNKLFLPFYYFLNQRSKLFVEFLILAAYLSLLLVFWLEYWLSEYLESGTFASVKTILFLICLSGTYTLNKLYKIIYLNAFLGWLLLEVW
jgi:hypothetical protein